MGESGKLDDLRAENARLIALLDAHGIAWKKPADPVLAQPPSKESESFHLRAKGMESNCFVRKDEMAEKEIDSGTEVSGWRHRKFACTPQS